MEPDTGERAEPLRPFQGFPDVLNDIILKAQAGWLKNTEVRDVLLLHAEAGLRVSTAPPVKPPGGTLFLFDRSSCRFFRRDSHNWKKKADGKTVRETHEKLKVGNEEVLNCYYAHADNSEENLQRRCYWLLESHNPVVLVHYLNVAQLLKAPTAGARRGEAARKSVGTRTAQPAPRKARRPESPRVAPDGGAARDQVPARPSRPSQANADDNRFATAMEAAVQPSANVMYVSRPVLEQQLQLGGQQSGELGVAAGIGVGAEELRARMARTGPNKPLACSFARQAELIAGCGQALATSALPAAQQQEQAQLYTQPSAVNSVGMLDTFLHSWDAPMDDDEDSIGHLGDPTSPGWQAVDLAKEGSGGAGSALFSAAAFLSPAGLKAGVPAGASGAEQAAVSSGVAVEAYADGASLPSPSNSLGLSFLDDAEEDQEDGDTAAGGSGGGISTLHSVPAYAPARDMLPLRGAPQQRQQSGAVEVTGLSAGGSGSLPGDMYTYQQQQPVGVGDQQQQQQRYYDGGFGTIPDQQLMQQQQQRQYEAMFQQFVKQDPPPPQQQQHQFGMLPTGVQQYVLQQQQEHQRYVVQSSLQQQQQFFPQQQQQLQLTYEAQQQQQLGPLGVNGYQFLQQCFTQHHPQTLPLQSLGPPPQQQQQPQQPQQQFQAPPAPPPLPAPPRSSHGKALAQRRKPHAAARKSHAAGRERTLAMADGARRDGARRKNVKESAAAARLRLGGGGGTDAAAAAAGGEALRSAASDAAAAAPLATYQFHRTSSAPSLALAAGSAGAAEPTLLQPWEQAAAAPHSGNGVAGGAAAGNAGGVGAADDELCLLESESDAELALRSKARRKQQRSVGPGGPGGVSRGGAGLGSGAGSGGMRAGGSWAEDALALEEQLHELDTTVRSKLQVSRGGSACGDGAGSVGGGVADQVKAWEARLKQLESGAPMAAPAPPSNKPQRSSKSGVSGSDPASRSAGVSKQRAGSATLDRTRSSDSTSLALEQQQLQQRWLGDGSDDACGTVAGDVCMSDSGLAAAGGSNADEAPAALPGSGTQYGHRRRQQPGRGVGVRYNLLDFSPDWDMPAGGAKVLLTIREEGGAAADAPPGGGGCGRASTQQQGVVHDGSSDGSGGFTGPLFVMFGRAEVPVEVLAPGVLRCYAPPHGPGTVTLSVTRGDGVPCCEGREFEYRAMLPGGSAADGRSMSATDLSDRELQTRLVDALLAHRLPTADAAAGNGFGAGSRCSAGAIGSDGCTARLLLQPSVCSGGGDDHPAADSLVMVGGLGVNAGQQRPNAGGCAGGGLRLDIPPAMLQDGSPGGREALLTLLLEHEVHRLTSDEIERRSAAAAAAAASHGRLPHASPPPPQQQQQPAMVCGLLPCGMGLAHLTAALGYDWALQMLLAAGADLDGPDCNGLTPLHWAAARGREDTVALLLARGCRPAVLALPPKRQGAGGGGSRAGALSGMSPADVAALRGHQGIAAYIGESMLIDSLSRMRLQHKHGAPPSGKGAAVPQRKRTRRGLDGAQGLGFRDGAMDTSASAANNPFSTAPQLQQQQQHQLQGQPAGSASRWGVATVAMVGAAAQPGAAPCAPGSSSASSVAGSDADEVAEVAERAKRAAAIIEAAYLSHRQRKAQRAQRRNRLKQKEHEAVARIEASIAAWQHDVASLAAAAASSATHGDSPCGTSGAAGAQPRAWETAAAAAAAAAQTPLATAAFSAAGPAPAATHPALGSSDLDLILGLGKRIVAKYTELRGGLLHARGAGSDSELPDDDETDVDAATPAGAGPPTPWSAAATCGYNSDSSVPRPSPETLALQPCRRIMRLRRPPPNQHLARGAPSSEAAPTGSLPAPGTALTGTASAGLAAMVPGSHGLGFGAAGGGGGGERAGGSSRSSERADLLREPYRKSLAKAVGHVACIVECEGARAQYLRLRHKAYCSAVPQKPDGVLLHHSPAPAAGASGASPPQPLLQHGSRPMASSGAAVLEASVCQQQQQLCLQLRQEQHVSYQSQERPQQYQSQEQMQQYELHEQPQQYQSHVQPQQYQSHVQPQQYQSQEQPQQYQSQEQPQQYQSHEQPQQYPSQEQLQLEEQQGLQHYLDLFHQQQQHEEEGREALLLPFGPLRFDDFDPPTVGQLQGHADGIGSMARDCQQQQQHKRYHHRQQGSGELLPPPATPRGDSSGLMLLDPVLEILC